MLLTLADAKASRLTEVDQTCSDTEEFKSLLNEATQALMTRGDWAGAMATIRVCVRGGCVTWPRWVGKVRRLNYCGQEVKVGNLWWGFVDQDRNYWRGVRDGYAFGSGLGLGGAVQFRMLNQGRYPTYNDVPENIDCYLRIYPLTQKDIGATLQVFGIDNNGQPLMTQDATTGEWSDGITITAAVPYAQSTVYVKRIDRVIKSITEKNLQLFAYAPSNGSLFDLAVYEPGETLPNYERDMLHIGGICCSTRVKSVTALVKLNFIPAKVDSDFILISNVRALKFMVQAIKMEEANQDTLAQLKVAKAVKELNLELDDQYPRDQTPVDKGFMGGEAIGFQRVI